MTRELDFTEAIYGALDPSEDAPALHEGERVTILLFQAGGLAMKPTVEVDTVRISELGIHLEEFEGRDVTDPNFDDDLSRGSQLNGVYNHATSTVFITSIDGNQVAQEPEFYNASPPTDR